MLEWIALSAQDLSGRDDAEDLIADRWTAEVAKEVEASEANAIERSYGPAARWPAYGRIAAGVKVDGVALAHELADVPIERRLPEKELSSADRRIRGTADLIILDEGGTATIIDHKAGDVREEDVGGNGRYEQQVLLYAAMARDSGFPPAMAEIRPLGRPAKPVELSSARLSSVVEEAHIEMDRYNDAVARGRAVDLANPSESSCGWCPFILDCPAVWVDPQPDLGEIAVLEGEVETIQVLASSLALRVRRADANITVSGAPVVDIRGRPPAPGDRVRLAGLRQSSADRMRGHPGRVLLSVL